LFDRGCVRGGQQTFIAAPFGKLPLIGQLRCKRRKITKAFF
jgi:hypothetical protein